MMIFASLLFYLSIETLSIKCAVDVAVLPCVTDYLQKGAVYIKSLHITSVVLCNFCFPLSGDSDPVVKSHLGKFELPQ